MTDPADTMRSARARDCFGPIACFVGLGFYIGTWGAMLPAIKHAADVSDGQLGLLLMLGAVTTPVGMWLASPLVERFGARVLAAVTGVFAIAALAPAHVHGPVQLALVLCGVGMLGSMLDTTMNVAVSALELHDRHMMHLAHALFAAGMLVGSLAVGAARASGQSIGAIFGVLAASLLLVAATNLPRPSVSLRAPRSSGRRGRRFQLRSRTLLLLGAIGCLAFILEGGVSAWSAIHLEQSLNVEPGVSALGPAAIATSLLVGRLLIHRFGSDADPYRLLARAGVLAAAGIVAMALASDPRLAIASLLVAALGLSICIPTVFALAGRAAGAGERGAAMATVTTLSWTGEVAGPACIGTLAGALGLRAALVALGLLGLPMALLALRGASTRGTSRAPAQASATS
jgi:MFS family permease